MSISKVETKKLPRTITSASDMDVLKRTMSNMVHDLVGKASQPGITEDQTNAIAKTAYDRLFALVMWYADKNGVDISLTQVYEYAGNFISHLFTPQVNARLSKDLWHTGTAYNPTVDIYNMVFGHGAILSSVSVCNHINAARAFYPTTSKLSIITRDTLNIMREVHETYRNSRYDSNLSRYVSNFMLPFTTAMEHSYPNKKGDLYTFSNSPMIKNHPTLDAFMAATEAVGNYTIPVSSKEMNSLHMRSFNFYGQNAPAKVDPRSLDYSVLNTIFAGGKGSSAQWASYDHAAMSYDHKGNLVQSGAVEVGIFADEILKPMFDEFVQECMELGMCFNPDSDSMTAIRRTWEIPQTYGNGLHNPLFSIFYSGGLSLSNNIPSTISVSEHSTAKYENNKIIITGKASLALNVLYKYCTENGPDSLPITGAMVGKHSLLTSVPATANDEKLAELALDRNIAAYGDIFHRINLITIIAAGIKKSD